MVQSLGVKICGFPELVCYKTKGIRKGALNACRQFYSGVGNPDVEIFRDGAGYHVPTKALLASNLMLAAFSLCSSVSSARVSLKSSGEGTEGGGFDSPLAEEVSESLIVPDKRTRAPAMLISGRSRETRGTKLQGNAERSIRVIKRPRTLSVFAIHTQFEPFSIDRLAPYFINDRNSGKFTVDPLSSTDISGQATFSTGRTLPAESCVGISGQALSWLHCSCV